MQNHTGKRIYPTIGQACMVLAVSLAPLGIRLTAMPPLPSTGAHKQPIRNRKGKIVGSVTILYCPTPGGYLVDFILENSLTTANRMV